MSKMVYITKKCIS